MRYHIVLQRSLDLDEIAQSVAAQEEPAYGMAMLAQRLNAQIQMPKDLPVSQLDQLYAKVLGPAQIWAFARSLATQLGSDDCLFVPSEGGGVQVATVCGAKRDRPKLAVFVHNLNRPRGRVALKLWNLAKRVDLFVACSQFQIDFLRRYLNLPESKVMFTWASADLDFFTPGPTSPDKTRPLIASVGLEQRDYQTLGAATADLDIDVKISGFSKDAQSLAKTFPDPLPANMSRRFYPWPELVQLYRDADVVVVSVRDNPYAAGVSTLIEAMACQRPIVATATAGLQDYLDPDAVITVKPGDAAGMREAIVYLLQHPEDAASRAQRGYQLAQERYGLDRYCRELADRLQSL